MNENKQFRVNDLVKFDYSEIGEYIDENHTDRPLRNDELVDLLNEKRFTIKPQDDYWAVVDNYNTICIINGIHTKIEAIWLCDFMNGQHSIICRDEISIKTMMFNMEKLEEENEQLRKDKEILKERLRECRIKMDKFNCR